MQTSIAPEYQGTAQGEEAEAILRKCVHCGFCLATCPTYNLLGDELDSPRGRIYLMKQVLEGAEPTAKTQLHLDRCLTCRACETTCPSGVQYGRLVDIGRDIVEKKVGRGTVDGLQRRALKTLLPQTALFDVGLTVGRAVKPLLPGALAKKITDKRAPGDWPAARHARKMLVLQGCVQPAMAPSINHATARVLDRLGISLVVAPNAGCCGAIPHHLNDAEAGHTMAKRNIDAWWPMIEAGAEAIVVTASGCGTMVAEYGHLLRDDVAYAEKAARVSALFRDVSQVIAAEVDALSAALRATAPGVAQRIAFHSPCSLQHGLKIRGVVEGLLRDAGFTLTNVPDGHLCCGSAGTYSLLQPELSQQLLSNKVRALESGAPDLVATANIGCLAHIEGGLRASSATPIRHWVEILDDRLQSAK
ncbi:MAG: glycolate oxidase subunit GlcF [Nitrosomonadaceae bacterium]|nr:glycolate oxidase subunit GlcF [Nitrosomonadaceae bacterium]